ncbi:MAG: ABC transporter ATP-binding protein [Rhodobacteraceae bacterium]|jgi:spermidine/putrescine transport system ATP-binding protein|nr:ABC transporter ATP-binding protein [Paracoccaceae bacterium]
MRQGVELEAVSKTFRGFRAVDGVSFRIPEGSFFSLLGPSGCGKSTTLRMLSGFEDPDSGRIWIGDQVMNGVPAYRRPTNMVFQRWALFPHMTAYENVAFGPSVARVPRADRRRQVMEALALVGLTDFADRKPRQLSGGQMQRVALARALVNKPRVLLLDEPLGALDLKLRLQMQGELKRIQESVGATFVYVTHDQGEALTMSDQVAIMRDGRIEQIGAPHEVYDAPATRFVASFLGNANLLPVTVQGIDGQAAKVALGGLVFEARVGQTPAAGTGVVALRYEAVRIGAAAEGQPVRTRGRILEASFAGSSVHYVVAAEPGFTLTVEDRHRIDEPPWPRGTLVDLGWHGAAARLFPEAG